MEHDVEIVDAQIHLWQGGGAPQHHRQTPFLVEEALAEMDTAGVDRALNCPAIWDPRANDYAAEVAAQQPDRIASLGWFPLEGEPAPREVDRLMERPGMLGLRFVLAMPDLAERLATGDLDWVWERADELELPVALMVHPAQIPLVGDIATRFPATRLVVDHLGVLPFLGLPEAAAHLDTLLKLAQRPNVAVKASGVPSMATDLYPFESTHEVLRRTLDAFGPERVFWGSDITRMPCSWRECVTAFAEELPWLAGDDLALVMGRAVRRWVGWL
ncbi:amidohydrolase family protein [Phycicoccus flavus]|uniref:Amidohydrolase family protein n=1 Tax=Phycicoccus flavus TaxID=2502783 RepID=A0A8T6R436_9MICO|nr:amidohydrolase family protein [Phycicoccus flavus]NHA68616.1 amidohydrolase family protein [Phycicoccus flavus]NHA68685.1 amidohydrolase family protein [Phycicoccus flavus]